MKAVLSTGTILEGTPQEVADAIRVLGGSTLLHEAKKPVVQGRVADIGSIVWTEERARALWACLDGDQKEVVRYLLKHHRSTLEQLKKLLGKKTGNGVAGVLANISRNARRETHYDRAKVVTKVRAEDGKKYYQIVDEVRDLLGEIE